MKKICSFLIIAVLLLLVAMPVSASTSEVPYENYIYSEIDGSVVSCPQAYLPSVEIFSVDLGIENMNSPSDMDTDENGDLYILDTGNNRIVILNNDLSLKTTFSCITTSEDGSQLPLNGAQGITVNGNYVYICDTNNGRILVFEKNSGFFVKEFHAPSASSLGDKFIFKPARLEVDSEDNLYVVCNGIYEGILNLNTNGEFLGYFASNKVSTSAWDLFWRNFSTVEQRKKMVQLIPQDFSSIDMDADGFFFVTTYTAIGGSMVQRVNPGGNNIIKNKSAISTVGDPGKVYGGPLEGKSSFSDVAAGPHKIYACLDKTHGRVFCYNNEGYLLYNFGIISDRVGGFSNPVAVTYLDDERVAVLDMVTNSITVFEPTEYAKTINLGVKYFNELDYDAARTQWENVLSLKENFELALNMIGRSYYNDGEYEKAMDNFKRSGNDEMYSNAKKELRANLIYDYSWLIVVAIVIVIALSGWRFIVRIKNKKDSSDDYD